MHKGIASQVVRALNDQISAGNKIVVDHKVRNGSDIFKIFKGFPGDAQNVRALFLDLPERFRRPFDRLIDNDRFHLGIIGQIHDRLDRDLFLLDKVIRINGKRHHIRPIFLLKGFGASPVVFGLRYRTRYDPDVKIVRVLFRFRGAPVFTSRTAILTCVCRAVFCIRGIRHGAVYHFCSVPLPARQQTQCQCGCKQNAHQFLFHHSCLP